MFPPGPAEDPSLPEPIRRSLDASWKEGVPAAVMLAVMDYYLVPFALFLGATTQKIGFLVSLPHLLGSVAQLSAVRAVGSAGSRLRFLVRGTAVQALLLFPAAGLAVAGFPWRVEALIGIMIAFRVLGNYIGAAWGSLMSDYLPPEKRGHYFGWRSQIVGIAGLAGVIGGGLILTVMRGKSEAMGFFILFFGAGVFRMLSFYLMTKMADLPWHRPPGSDFTFLMFVRRFRESNFVQYVLFVSGITFATHISAPYFSVFLLRDLKISYLSYMCIQLAAVMSGLLSFPIWGKHADIVGNAKILKITSFVVPLIPFLWLVSTNRIYLFSIEILAGFIWGGFNLCATNFIYDAVSPAKRVRCLGYFNLINGIAIFAGAGIGGFLADRLPPVAGHAMYTLFIVSGVLRFCAHFFLSRRFQEVRARARYVSSGQLFFSVLGFRPLAGLNQE